MLQRANCASWVLTIYLKLYFEHAEIYGPLLNLKVAQKKTTAGPVSMVDMPTNIPLAFSPSFFSEFMILFLGRFSVLSA